MFSDRDGWRDKTFAIGQHTSRARTSPGLNLVFVLSCAESSSPVNVAVCLELLPEVGGPAGGLLERPGLQGVGGGLARAATLQVEGPVKRARPTGETHPLPSPPMRCR